MEDFIPYNEALALKELGFDDICFGVYVSFYESTKPDLSLFWNEKYNDFDIVVNAPTYSQAFRWFRDNYKLFHHIFSKNDQTFVSCIRWYINGMQKDTPYESSIGYEEAELACLRKLIEITKTNRNHTNQHIQFLE